MFINFIRPSDIYNSLKPSVKFIGFAGGASGICYAFGFDKALRAVVGHLIGRSMGSYAENFLHPRIGERYANLINRSIYIITITSFLCNENIISSTIETIRSYSYRIFNMFQTIRFTGNQMRNLLIAASALFGITQTTEFRPRAAIFTLIGIIAASIFGVVQYNQSQYNQSLENLYRENFIRCDKSWDNNPSISYRLGLLKDKICSEYIEYKTFELHKDPRLIYEKDLT